MGSADTLSIDTPDIREILQSGDAIVRDVGVARRFGEYIEALPRVGPTGFRVEWEVMPGWQSIDYYQASDEDFVAWARGLAIGQHPDVVIWYNDASPCLLCTFEYGLANADVMFRCAPGTRYVFGADRRRGDRGDHFGHFLEFGVGSRVTGVSRVGCED